MDLYYVEYYFLPFFLRGTSVIPETSVDAFAGGSEEGEGGDVLSAEYRVIASGSLSAINLSSALVFIISGRNSSPVEL